MLRLIRNLVRPYKRSLALVLAAMLVETLASLAMPWPLKVVLDNVVGGSRLPHWMSGFLRIVLGGEGKTQIALLAGIGFVAIAAIGAIASYIDSYTSETVAQGVAHDLRMRTYHHLQRLSLAYYDKHRVGASLSTLTSDIDTIQDFASSGTLGIVVDILAVFGMFAADVLAELGFRANGGSSGARFCFGSFPGTREPSRTRRRTCEATSLKWSRWRCSAWNRSAWWRHSARSNWKSRG